jgi:KDO2-lipid IV(A) lauroyltransferase
VLVATAHFGNWDIAGALLATEGTLHVIAETFRDRRLNDLVQRQRRVFGMEIIPLELAPRRMLRVLQQGGTVATPVDRPLPAGQGVPVNFFGRRCYVPSGLAQLALRTGAPIVPGFAWYDEEYSAQVCACTTNPIVPAPTGDRQADTIALTQQIYDAIAEMVRARPDQWYMFRPFWPVEPAAAPAAEPPEVAAVQAGASAGGSGSDLPGAADA